MSSAQSLVAIFDAIADNIERDRADLNHLDRDDGDSGDNMAANFRMISNTLTKSIGKRDTADIGAALSQAATVLRDKGQGATAPIYAEGLSEAAQRLAGRNSFSLSDLMPLLEGLLGGAQRAQGGATGNGSLLDVLVPGIMAYMQGKQRGMSDTEALLNALLNLRRGANSTAGSAQGWGKGSGRSTSGEIDPGAAGAASLLEGLFGALLQSAMRGQGRGQAAPDDQPEARSETKPQGRSHTRSFPGPSNLPGTQSKDDPAPQADPASSILDILGGLFGKR